MPKKFLIVHLVSNGDCLMATTIAKQIKNDNPGCHLTWAISYKCKQVIEGNPFVDKIWEVNYSQNESPAADVWHKIKIEAEEKKRKGEFDEIIYSQIYPDNLHYYDGTIRSSTFRAYRKPITIDVTPTIELNENEVFRVKQFALKHELQKYKHVILCECAPSSGQSFLNPELMLALASAISAKRPDIIFIISTHLKLETNTTQIISASELTFRENAELSKHCTLLVGCSSGITWLLTSNWAKKINTVQFIYGPSKAGHFASVIYDFTYFNLNTDNIIETSIEDNNQMISVILDSLANFKEAKIKYSELLTPSLSFLKYQLYRFYQQKRISEKVKVFTAIDVFFKRNKYSFKDKILFAGSIGVLFVNWLFKLKYSNK
jgi:ADP-heptose:LPS heptosyltransferase